MKIFYKSGNKTELNSNVPAQLRTRTRDLPVVRTAP